MVIKMLSWLKKFFYKNSEELAASFFKEWVTNLIKNGKILVFLPAGSGLGGAWISENWIVAIPITVVVGIILWLWLFRTKIPFDSNLFGREKEKIKLVNKIRTGQSAAIIGIFGKERTELLNSLRDPNPYGHEANNLIFSYMDISSLELNCTQEQFWKKALQPLGEKVSSINNRNRQVVTTYMKCQENDFNQDCLDNLFEELNQVKLRLVLQVDRIHEILDRPNLIKETFLGKLRSLSTLNKSLCIVVTAHESLKKLHKKIIITLGYEIPNSPFLNHIDVNEITLGALSINDINRLLKKLKISKKALPFIKHKVGQHPYLLRIAYHTLKDAELSEDRNSAVKVAEQDFKQKCQYLLDDMLANWSLQMRHVFIEIAQSAFNNLDKYVEELKELEKVGLIQKSRNDQWQVISPIFIELLKK
jgi:hypothetical protein